MLPQKEGKFVKNKSENLKRLQAMQTNLLSQSQSQERLKRQQLLIPRELYQVICVKL